MEICKQCWNNPICLYADNDYTLPEVFEIRCSHFKTREIVNKLPVTESEPELPGQMGMKVESVPTVEGIEELLQVPALKVGDRVRMKADLNTDTGYGRNCDYYITSKMAEFAGGEYSVGEIASNGSFSLKEDRDMHIFLPEMAELVEKPDELEDSTVAESETAEEAKETDPLTEIEQAGEVNAGAYPAKRKPNKLTAEIKAKILELNKTMKPYDIAKELGVGKSTVYNVIKESAGLK